MKGKGLILTGVGFIVGVAEALIYYNMGQAPGQKFSYKLPPSKELLKTASIVLVTSIITTGLFTGLEMLMEPSGDNKQLAEK